MRLPTIAERAEHVRLLTAAACRRCGRSPEDVTIVAITKGFPPAAIQQAVSAGFRHLGENRVQEAQAKRPALADLPGVTWHMVGHLQSNKVKTALELFDIIHSVDSLHLAEAISRRALREAPVFLEVNVGGEVTKHGFTLAELPQRYESIARLPKMDVRGLMTVAPLAPHPDGVRPVFRRLREAAAALGLRELSMGMSDDFEAAVEEGATHLRIGRAIFGERK
ncbi:MAG: YggS family pyridoxal phosphate-dependent enzyme [Dehalococcoidia bacterium]|nr:YggS family pyridoxal phosphate-dependent enzyme [Dehalococcoidia bacterium]